MNKLTLGSLFRLASIIVFALTMTACATRHELACKHKEQLLTNDSLYFGTGKVIGKVTPEEWTRFLKDTVTPRFPQGLTAWPASGQWRAPDGLLVREESYVLNIIHPADEAGEAGVLAVIAAYKTQFQQVSVLRVRANVCASF